MSARRRMIAVGATVCLLLGCTSSKSTEPTAMAAQATAVVSDKHEGGPD